MVQVVLTSVIDKDTILPLIVSNPNRKMLKGLRLQGIVKKGAIQNPLVSVVTVSFNAGHSIEATLKSVLGQTYDPIEYIVIDGGSNDNTLKILHTYQNEIDLIVSEPDEGITHAMNKGVQYSLGDYLIFIHAGDRFMEPSSLGRALEFMRPDYPPIGLCNILFGKEKRVVPARGFDIRMNFKMGNPHQGILCARSVFDTLGHFDPAYRICADYHFFLKAYKRGLSAKRLPLTLSLMDGEGISSRKDWEGLHNRFMEEKQIHLSISKNRFIKTGYSLYWFAYLTYRKCRYWFETHKRAH